MYIVLFFFFKQKTAYEIRISDWSSDVCSSDLVGPEELAAETMIARRSCEFLDATSRFFTRHGVRPRFALRSESDERCLRMVAAGIGITTAPVSLAIDGIVPLKVAGYDFRRELGLIADPAWRTLDRKSTRLNSSH